MHMPHHSSVLVAKGSHPSDSGTYSCHFYTEAIDAVENFCNVLRLFFACNLLNLSSSNCQTLLMSFF